MFRVFALDLSHRCSESLEQIVLPLDKYPPLVNVHSDLAFYELFIKQKITRQDFFKLVFNDFLNSKRVQEQVVLSGQSRIETKMKWETKNTTSDLNITRYMTMKSYSLLL